MKYRKEIDGLRALAVIPVILFHAGFSVFSGGYIGVDVFFVISGYLITSILINDLKQQKFSLLHFYERRARRILPALVAVVGLTYVSAFVLMPPDLLKDFSLSMVNVGTFTSNFYFYFTSGYFATLAEEKPLLHTWSLAVEEQYYLIFPVLLSVLWAKAKNGLIAVLVTLTVLSFCYSQYLLSQNQLDANFYLIFSRAWELFFGSFLAFIKLKRIQTHKSINEVASLLGLAMVLYSIFMFTEETPFPGFATLIPVIGTCLVIAFSSSQSWVGRLLSMRILVTLGLMSYSLYLWHQPLLAFVKMKTVGVVPEKLIWGAILLSLILAYLSLKYIEKPFRNKLFLTRKKIFIWSVFSLILMLIVGGFTYQKEGFPNRFGTNPYKDSMLSSPMHRKCNSKGVDYLKPKDSCTYLGSKITWAVLGDSHVVEPAYALAKRLEQKDEGLLHLSFTACANGYSIDLNIPKGCSAWTKEAVAEILKRDEIKNVLIAYRYSMHLFGARFPHYPEVPNISPLPYINKDFRKTMEGSARENYWSSLNDTINALTSAGKKVFVIYPIPELPIDFEKASTPFSIISDQSFMDLQKITSLDFYLKRNQFILNKLDSLNYNENLVSIKPRQVFCDQKFCSAVKNGKALYRDDDHLSIHGAELIIDLIDLKN